MKVCPNCNTENRDAALFCGRCGYAFPAQTPAAQIAPAVQSVPAAQKTPTPTPPPQLIEHMPNYKKPKKWLRMFTLITSCTLLVAAVLLFYISISAIAADGHELNTQPQPTSEPYSKRAEVHMKYDGFTLYRELIVYGNEGDVVTLSNPAVQATVSGGNATFLLAESEWIENKPDPYITNQLVAITATITKSSGGTATVKLPEFGITVPVTPIYISSPANGAETNTTTNRFELIDRKSTRLNSSH